MKRNKLKEIDVLIKKNEFQLASELLEKTDKEKLSNNQKIELLLLEGKIKHGLNLYQGFFKTTHKINEHLVSGIATAIAAFATEIIGEEVFPREIDLGEYSLILDKPGKFAGFIACKFPSSQIHQGLKRVMANYQPEMGFDEVSKIIADYLPYGLPEKDPNTPTYRRIVE